jgi:hypothetical protein
MISKKAIWAGIFSAIVGIGMLAMPVKAMAHDWDHDGDGWRHEHRDNGQHSGWYNHGGGNNSRFNHRGDEKEEHEERGYYQQPYHYGYGHNHEPDADDYGHRGYGYGYGRQSLPSNGQGMVNPRNPALVWSCDSHGHHCHWTPRYGYGVNPNGGYGDNSGYGNDYYGNNGYYGSPLDGLGSLLRIPMP